MHFHSYGEYRTHSKKLGLETTKQKAVTEPRVNLEKGDIFLTIVAQTKL